VSVLGDGVKLDGSVVLVLAKSVAKDMLDCLGVKSVANGNRACLGVAPAHASVLAFALLSKTLPSA